MTEIFRWKNFTFNFNGRSRAALDRTYFSQSFYEITKMIVRKKVVPKQSKSTIETVFLESNFFN